MSSEKLEMVVAAHKIGKRRNIIKVIVLLIWMESFDMESAYQKVMI